MFPLKNEIHCGAYKLFQEWWSDIDALQCDLLKLFTRKAPREDPFHSHTVVLLF